MNITITFLMNVFQKAVMDVVYFFILKKNFNYKKRSCDRYHKILLKTEFEHRDMCIIWWNNCKYRVLNTLKHRQVKRLMEREKLQGRYGYIDIENMNYGL